MQERIQITAGSQEKSAAPEQAIFPPCVRAGQSQSKATGKRNCHLFDRLRWVTPEQCAACPLAGLLADAAKEAEAKLWEKKPKGARKQAQKAVIRRGVDLSCVHRGLQVSTVGCKSCSGQVDVAVFACTVHEDCTLTRDAGGGTAICATCKDRTPQLVQLEPPA